MSDYWLEAGSFLLRWLHVIAAIAWIGESFYFVMLDRALKPPKDGAPGVFGELWSVHGGGFYHKRKYLVAPPALPDELHWSMWKSYTTWLSGFALFALMYLTAPGLYLIDPAVAPLTPLQAVALSLSFLFAGWLVYHALCKAVGLRDGVLGGAVLVLVVLMSYAACALFSGRGAFLLVGATLATIMSANVLFVIIPGQRRMVAALRRGETPDPLPGRHGKQRSVHNTYFTLPVVFAMLSTHYAPAYAHPHNWLVLLLFMLAGALIRHFFVLWHSGGRAWGLLVLGGALLLGALAWIAPPRPARAERAAIAVLDAAQAVRAAVDTTAVHAILTERCAGCHSAQPKLMPFAPKGAMFDTLEQIEAQALSIHQQTVVLKIMPPGNLTQMTDDERALIDRWVRK